MKRMFAPDDEDKPFIRRWNLLTRILLVEPSVKLVARLAMDYASFEDGSSCFPSIDRMTRESGLSDRTVRNGWAVLRGLGMADRVCRGGSYRAHADEYQLQIPDGWKSLPILGPHGRKFTCPGCGKLFNPDAHSRLSKRPNEKGKDVVVWTMERLTFCSWLNRSGKKGSAQCLRDWDAKRKRAGEKQWVDLGPDRWDVFWKARDDPW